MFTDEEILELFTTKKKQQIDMESSEKKKSLFDVLKKITYNEKLDNSDLKLINSFLLLKWISNDRHLIKLASELNDQSIPLIVMVDVIRSQLKKDRIRYIKWIKSKKLLKKDRELKEMIQREYNLNDKRYEEVIDLISREHIDYLTKKYKEK